MFAGPNGSGKSTIIQAVRAYRVNTIPVNFGLYINADDIARSLRDNTFDFSEFEIRPTYDQVIQIAQESGLLANSFSTDPFRSSFTLEGTHLQYSTLPLTNA